MKKQTALMKFWASCPALCGFGAVLAAGAWCGCASPVIADATGPSTPIVQQSDQPDAAVSPNTLSARATIALLHAEKDPYWLTAKNFEFRSVADLFAQHDDELARGVVRRILLEGDTSKMDIALTFDDGPHAESTPELLHILDENHVKATFFLVGEKAEEDPELVQAEVADGEDIGNHTYNHVSLVKIPRKYIATEIKACGEVLNSITGQDPHLFRPPGGAYDPNVSETSDFLGYTTVLWTDDPGDYKSPGAQVILQRTLDKATPGGIILLHDGINQTMQILPALIQILRERGYHFVTIDQMLADKDARLAKPVISLAASNQP